MYIVYLVGMYIYIAKNDTRTFQCQVDRTILPAGTELLFLDRMYLGFVNQTACFALYL